MALVAIARHRIVTPDLLPRDSAGPSAQPPLEQHSRTIEMVSGTEQTVGLLDPTDVHRMSVAPPLVVSSTENIEFIEATGVALGQPGSPSIADVRELPQEYGRPNSL